MKPASPLPWSHTTVGYTSRTADANNETLWYMAHADESERQNDAFIVHACNLHHDLVAACVALYETSNDDRARAMAFKALEKAGVH